MKVNIKKVHVDAKIPQYAKPGDAGMDLTCIKITYEAECIVYDTGIQMEIPEGHVGLLFPRSSLAKQDLTLSNHVGVLDSGYRGTIMFKYKPNFNYWNSAKDQAFFQGDLETGLFTYYETKEHEHFEHVIQSPCYSLYERVGQIIILPYPNITFEEIGELSLTERGSGGFGSTGI